MVNRKLTLNIKTFKPEKVWNGAKTQDKISN